jgi:transcriptional regulator with XRE-family HTH domain
MPTKNMTTDRHADLVRNFDRGMLRSAFASLFCAVISDRRKREGYKLKHLSDALGCDKSHVSRWFSNEPPNWQVDTIADVAGALGLDLRIAAQDRQTGQIYTPAGPQRAAQVQTKPQTSTITSAPDTHPVFLIAKAGSVVRVQPSAPESEAA